jgi:hypothetical protein
LSQCLCYLIPSLIALEPLVWPVGCALAQLMPEPVALSAALSAYTKSITCCCCWCCCRCCYRRFATQLFPQTPHPATPPPQQLLLPYQASMAPKLNLPHPPQLLCPPKPLSPPQRPPQHLRLHLHQHQRHLVLKLVARVWARALGLAAGPATLRLLATAALPGRRAPAAADCECDVHQSLRCQGQ